MISKGTSFAKYTRTLCAIVSFIWLLLAILVLTGEGENSLLKGSLWLLGSVALGVSAIYAGRKAAPEENIANSEQTSE